MMQAFSAWIAIALAPSASGGNLAERLGYPPDARVLILHADDLGMCHEGNAAGREALEAGTVSSGSVMVPCPWFPEFAAWARERPEWDLGVHLTLNSEWRGYRWGPVASSSEVPSLLDEEGYFYRDTRSLVQNARAEEVERECRAQVERALRFGIRPTHLDTHMGAALPAPGPL
ncbi:MAG: hypothetical protein KatS3mg115_0979 [Candidatus Poribacteria bacterium]|nr:MAG: hypothetical protein KatS3mg115_0979 [Candidatus Poribacteria bacterium]